jgi:hypothetical protein
MESEREPAAMATTRLETESDMARPGLLPALKVVAWLFVALVLVQALLAGRGWFIDADLLDVHRSVGMVVIVVAVVQAALAFAVFGWGRAGRPIVLAGAALLVLTVIQFALGMASDDSASAAAWHIPNGVLIFGLATATTSMLVRVRRPSS